MHYALACFKSIGEGASNSIFEIIDAETLKPCLDFLPIQPMLNTSFEISGDGKWLLIENNYYIKEEQNWNLVYELYQTSNWTVHTTFEKIIEPTPWVSVATRTDTIFNHLFSPDGRYLILIYSTGVIQSSDILSRIRILDLTDFSIYYEYVANMSNPYYPTYIPSQAISPDNHWWIISFQREILCFDLFQKKFVELPFEHPFTEFEDDIGFDVIAFSPNGHYLFLAPSNFEAYEHSFHIVNMHTFLLMDMEFIEQFVTYPYGFIIDAKFTLDSKYIIISGFFYVNPAVNNDLLTAKYNGPYVLDTETWKLLDNVEPALQATGGIALHPDGKHFALHTDVGYFRESSILNYDIETWNIIKEFKFFERDVEGKIIPTENNYGIDSLQYFQTPLIYTIQGTVFNNLRQPVLKNLIVVDEETGKSQIDFITEENGTYSFSFIYPKRKAIVVLQPETDKNDYIVSRIKPT